MFDKVNLWQASMVGVRNLSSVKSMDEANIYEIKINGEDLKLMKKHKTLDLGDYPAFFKYFLNKGMSKGELREIFLWTAHSYPGEDF